MTTGTETFGDLGIGAMYYRKSWSGTNGKTEAWIGGTRDKWNQYDLTHVKMSQKTSPNVWNNWLPSIQQLSVSGVGSKVGWTANDDLRLLNKLAENIRGHSLNLGINIAEATKTYQTIVSNLQSIGSALLHLKRGNFAFALRALGAERSGSLNAARLKGLREKDLTGRWLETQYAFIPLVHDAYEAGKALKSLTRTRTWTFTAGSGKRTVLEKTPSNNTYFSYVHWTYSKRIRAELSEDIPLERSLGLTNPAVIAWEVVPYSFVVDWFLPVGSYLEAFGIIPKLKGRFCTTERGTGVRQGIHDGPNPPIPGSNAAASYDELKGHQRKETYSVYKRTPSSGLSVPAPTFNRLPKALSPGRILNAVALIHQRLR